MNLNFWMEQSIEFANQGNYLDELFKVYPTIPEGMREIAEDTWENIENAFHKGEKRQLIELLLSLELFPIKDSYVAFLKRDRSAIDRNPETINRLYGRLCELGINRIWEKCTDPKETNRQMGNRFWQWLRKDAIGVPLISDIKDFISTKNNAILNASDAGMKSFAQEYLNYQRNKGLDFVAKFNGQYIIAEAKFLTDFGGHQNVQFNDAIGLLETEGVEAIKIAILDGVLYIKGNNKMYKTITREYSEENIMSALVLRDFLYQV